MQVEQLTNVHIPPTNPTTLSLAPSQNLCFDAGKRKRSDSRMRKRTSGPEASNSLMSQSSGQQRFRRRRSKSMPTSHGGCSAPEDDELVRVHPEVLSALAEQRPVVGLESAVITHGLPKEPRPELLQQLGDPFATKSHLPVHLALAEVMEESVRESGAIPATTAVIEGELVVGLTDAERHELAHHPSAIKAAPHRLSTMIATKATGGTTVGGALTLLHRGHPDLKVLATGGIGGVHRGWINRPDISADLTVLSRTPLMCVCTGAKIVLDAATFEALETLGISPWMRLPFIPSFPCPWRRHAPHPLLHSPRSGTNRPGPMEYRIRGRLDHTNPSSTLGVGAGDTGDRDPEKRGLGDGLGPRRHARPARGLGSSQLGSSLARELGTAPAQCSLGFSSGRRTPPAPPP